MDLSLRRVRSTVPFWVVTTSSVDAAAARRLDEAGIPHCALPFDIAISADAAASNAATGYTHWTATFGKLGLFSMTRWQKLVSIDADMMVLRNIDDVLSWPHLSAVAAGRSFYDQLDWRGLNSGLVVIEPREGLAEELVASIPALLTQERTGHGGAAAIGDQDVLNAYFADWPQRTELHLSEGCNVMLDHLDFYIEHFRSSGAGPDALRVVHFVGGAKPWLLSRTELLRAAYRFVATGRPRAAQYLLAYAWLLRAAGHRF